MAERQWRGKTAGGRWMHRWLIGSTKVIPLPMLYAFAAVCVIPFCMLFSHKGYIAAYHFFRRQMGQGVWQSFWNTYLNHCRFAQVIIDRFRIYGGGRFDFDIDNYECFQQLAQGRQGFVILSAHVGNYEAAGYALVSNDKRFNALVYGDEAEIVMQNRWTLFSANNIRMIPVESDMSHLFEISNALANGEIMSIPADRIFGSPRTVRCRLMGAEASFPVGPFATACQRDVPVLTIHVMKTGLHRYRIYIKTLAHTEGPMRQRIQHLAGQYAATLEEVLYKHPTQWFNYYEFWN